MVNFPITLTASDVTFKMAFTYTDAANVSRTYYRTVSVDVANDNLDPPNPTPGATVKLTASLMGANGLPVSGQNLTLGLAPGSGLVTFGDRRGEEYEYSGIYTFCWM